MIHYANIRTPDIKMSIDLATALKKLHQLQLEDGDIGGEYWLQIATLLKNAQQYRERAEATEGSRCRASIFTRDSSMPMTTLPSFPSALRQLEDLGERLRLARRRRRITSILFAERMGVSRETLRRLEMGDPTIAIGTYARALQVLGLDNDINGIALDDELVRKLKAIAML